ncbi:hypothetical protein B0H11DRAFT_2257309 [Mycena galericulata]|nr:hypothetical protein B0H11DRAFT_2257309 [Mycena galericulata]
MDELPMDSRRVQVSVTFLPKIPLGPDFLPGAIRRLSISTQSIQIRLHHCEDALPACPLAREITARYEVGYSIRFEDSTSDKTVLKHMTDVMLLRQSRRAATPAQMMSLNKPGMPYILDMGTVEGLRGKRSVPRYNEFRGLFLLIPASTMDNISDSGIQDGDDVFDESEDDGAGRERKKPKIECKSNRERKALAPAAEEEKKKHGCPS